MTTLSDIRIVLTEPSHPGNIGAAARAMKAMGLCQLYLVNPAKFPHVEATARASGADDLLAKAKVVSSLQEALAGCKQSYAASARVRHLQWPLLDPRAFSSEVVSSQFESVAVVFGREHSGLTNTELELCQRQIHIPSLPEFSSLNLAQAVQVIAYELRMAKLAKLPPATSKQRELLAHDELEGFYEQLQTTLTAIEFIDIKQPKKLMTRLRRLFNRAEIDKTEINILRGILSTVMKRVEKV
ncbi:MAG: RNA methyltransferase [Gammaproteobacteria bacterium]|nr:RNA methyltransferase [Gammaproteobacteria bacterium]